jgi:hypothetical protein
MENWGKNVGLSWVWWCIPKIPALKRMFESSLGYIVKLSKNKNRCLLILLDLVLSKDRLVISNF